MRIFCPEPLPGHEIHPLFFFRFSPAEKFSDVFRKKLPRNFFEEKAEFTDIHKAEIVVIPNNFKSLDDKAIAHIKNIADQAEKRHLPVFAFSWGDLTDGLVFDPRVFVFRLSVYRSEMGPRDILMPTLVEDLGQWGITLRKKSDKPVVSFCGQAGYSHWKQWLKYYLKIALFRLQGIVNPFAPARIVGVYWRRAMLAACTRSEFVATNFIIRRSFSGAHKTIELDPTKAREEFIGSVVESDYVIAPKGDGNFSNRFLEALSLGRIPVVLSTDSVLPLEGYVPYSKCIVLVPMQEVSHTPDYIRAHYDSLNAEQFEEAQKTARDVFEKYLRVDSYFEFFFEKVLPDLRRYKM